MKSTGRKGLNKLTFDSDGLLSNEFTFTESSKLTKIRSRVAKSKGRVLFLAEEVEHRERPLIFEKTIEQ